MRITGSHHFFRKSGVAEAINLQPEKGKAKPYQVRQARKVLQKNLLLRTTNTKSLFTGANRTDVFSPRFLNCLAL